MHRPVVRVQDCRILEPDGWIKIGGIARFGRSRRVLKGTQLPRWDDNNRLTTTPGSLGAKFRDTAATNIKRRIFNASDGLSQQQLAAAIDSLAGRVVIFDADDRLLLGNKSWWQEQANFGLSPTIGDRYRDYVSDLADSGCIPGAVGREEEWVKFRLELRRQPGEAIEVPLFSGQISRIQDYKLPDGGTLTFTTTIAERLQTRRDLAASERSFQNFAAQSVEGIIVHRDSRPLFANQAFADIIGCSSPEDVLKLRSVDDYVAPSEIERLASYRERRKRGEWAPVNYEFQALHRNGQTMWLETRVTVIEWEGAPAIQSMHVDVTDRHDAVRALEASEKRFKDFADAASDWYWETDAEHHFTAVFGGDANDPAYRPLTTLGRTRVNEVSARDRQQRPEAWRKYLETIEAHQSIRDFVYAADMPDGNRYWLRTSGVPVFDEDGQFRGYRGVTANITEDVATRDREHATRKQLATAIDSISEPTTLWDKAGRLTLANQAWFGALEKIGAAAHIGMRYEEHVKSMIEARVFPEAAGYEQAWVEDWIERRRNAGTAYELETRFGTTILIRDHALPDGGIITFTTDVTELKRAEHEIRESEARLHGILETAPEAIVSTDGELRIQHFNRGAELLFGYRADEVRGQAIEILLPERHRSALQGLIKKISEAGGRTRAMSAPLTVIGLREGGIEFPGEAWISEHEIDGRKHYTVYVRDITDRKETEEALQSSQANLAEAQRLAQVGSWHWDLSTGVVQWSDELFNLLGLDPADTTPTIDGVWNAVHPQDRDRERIATQAAMASAEVSYQTVHRIVRPNGGVRVVHGKLKVVLWSDDGSPLSIVGSLQDITERKRTEDEREKLEKQLLHSQRMETIGTLAGGIAHDFNNILAPMTGYGELLREHLESDEQATGYVDRILDGATRASELVKQILAFSRRETGTKERLRVDHIASEALKLLRAAIPTTIDIRFSDDPDCAPILGDHTQIHQVVMNLCTNAAQAMGHERGTLAVTVGMFMVDEDFARVHSGLSPGPHV